MGSATLAVTNDSLLEAKRCAEELGDYLLGHRQDFVGQLISMDDALKRAAQSAGPICLLDMGDNTGGGSPADSTHLMHAIRRHQLRPAFVCLCDAPAVQAATQAGAGATLKMSVGGRTDRLHGEPYEDDFTVLGLYDGKFHEPQPRHGGFTHCDQGATAVVRGASGIDVMLTTRRMPPFSLRQLTTFGVDPATYHLLVAKGVNAPVAAYQPVCRQLIRVNTPGCTTADMEMLEFRHRRRPMFPFEEID
jgi:microcystin degradation protein MlrC